MRNPPHPGIFIRDEVVDANELTVGQVAELLGVARPTVSKLLNGRAALSAEMALRMEQVFGLRMDTLMAMQVAHDQAKARREHAGLRLKPFKRAS
jgi:addiction module HigA family antidote